MPIFRIPYCYLSKPAGTSDLKVYVAVPVQAREGVTFRQATRQGNAIRIEAEINSTFTADYPHEAYSFDLNNVQWSGATTVEVTISGSSKTATYSIAAADDFTPAAGQAALDCPYLCVTTLEAKPTERHPKVLIPSLKHEYRLPAQPGAEVPANNTASAQLSEVSIQSQGNPDNVVDWIEPTRINQHIFYVPAGQLGEAYFFDVSVTPPNAAGVPKRKSKQLSNNPVVQGGNGFSIFWINLLRRIGLLRAAF